MSDERVGIVTGGTRGIGAAITEALSADGRRVAAGYSRNRESAEKFVAGLAEKGRAVSIHQGNVGDPDDCRRVVDEVLEAHGRIDYLVNNAGITVDKTVRKMTVEDWHAVLRVNLSGAFYMTKAVLDHMFENGFGRIVNISLGHRRDRATSARPTTPRRSRACSGSPRAWPWRPPARASPSTAWPRASSTPRWWPPSRRPRSTR